MKTVTREIDGKIQKFNKVMLDDKTVLLLPVAQAAKQVKKPRKISTKAKQILNQAYGKICLTAPAKKNSFDKFGRAVCKAYHFGIISEFQLMTLFIQGDKS